MGAIDSIHVLLWDDDRNWDEQRGILLLVTLPDLCWQVYDEGRSREDSARDGVLN